MKKRRELDALVNGGKQSGTVKNGRHELLRNDSDSSEVEEFAMPQKSGVRLKRESYSSTCCSTCLAMCSGFLLVLCMVAIGGLTWMNIRLKSDVYTLQDRLTSLEQLTKDIPEQLHVVSEQQKLISDTSGLMDDAGQPVLKQSVDSMLQQMQALNSSLLVLARSQASSPTTGLHDLQDHFTQLTKNVANIGSELQEVQGTQKGLVNQLADLSSKMEELQLLASAGVAHKSTKFPAPSSTPSQPLEEYIQQQFRRFSNEMGVVNNTLSTRVGLLSTAVLSHAALLTSVRNETELLRSQFGELEKRMDSLNNISSTVEDSSKRNPQNSSDATTAAFLLAVRQSVVNVTSAVELLDVRTGIVEDRLSVVEKTIAKVTGKKLKVEDPANIVAKPPSGTNATQTTGTTVTPIDDATGQ